MSRCFVYPPPGYTLSKAGYDALIESIQLLKEREIAKKLKTERVKAKKLKKERGKSKKLKKMDKYGKKKTNLSNSCGLGDSKCGDLQKETKDETEQCLERSSITEEYLCYYSSDGSTENSSNKRKITHASAASNAATIVEVGSISRIGRLPSLKNIQQCNHDSRQTNQTQEDIPSIENLSKRYKKMESVADKYYTNLFEKWSIPSQLLVQCSDANDQEWLFARKKQEIKKQPDINNGGVIYNQIPCSSIASLCPSAQYLPAADIYCLPFCIPF